MKFRYWITVIVLALGLAALAGCGIGPSDPVPTPVSAPSNGTANTPAPGADNTPVAGAANTPASGSAKGSAGPIFSFMPRQGPAGIVLHAAGANFAPGAIVIIRIGIPDPVGDPLVSTLADQNGRWNASITVPGTLPSGQPITTTDAKILVMDESNNIVASQSFKYTSKP